MDIVGQGEGVWECVFKSEFGFKSRDGRTHSVANMRVLSGEVDDTWPVRHDDDIHCRRLDGGGVARRRNGSVKSIRRIGIRLGV